MCGWRPGGDAGRNGEGAITQRTVFTLEAHGADTAGAHALANIGGQVGAGLQWRQPDGQLHVHAARRQPNELFGQQA